MDKEIEKPKTEEPKKEEKKEPKVLFGGHYLEKGSPRTSEIARLGGIASGVAKRKKKLFRDSFEVALQKKIKSKRLIKKITQINPELGAADGIDHVGAIYASMFLKAVSGDVSAAEFIRDTIGERPVSKQEIDIPPVSEVSEDNIKEVTKRLNELMRGTNEK